MEEASFWRYAQCQSDNFLKNVFYNYYLFLDRNASHQLVNVSLRAQRPAQPMRVKSLQAINNFQ